MPPRIAKSVSVKSGTGFSLIELLVVLVIVGILGAFALPAYQQYGVRAKRVAAQAEMLDIANRQQQYLMSNRSYASVADLTAGGYVLSNAVGALYSYDIALSSSAVPGYTITFTPVAGGAQAGDGALALSSEGVKTPAEKW